MVKPLMASRRKVKPREETRVKGGLQALGPTRLLLWESGPAGSAGQQPAFPHAWCGPTPTAQAGERTGPAVPVPCSC